MTQAIPGSVEDLPADPRLVWASLSQAERDAAYDNGKAVIDSPAWMKRRDELSAAYRAAHAGALDIPYGSAARTAFDLYPAADPEAPCLVFIHGGYWMRNSREVFACIATGLNAAGWSVAIPGYTLAPQSSLTGIATEIGQALDWLGANGPAHGIAGKLVISGWSAGGHLAALHLGHPHVAAGLAISGVYELGPIRDTYINDALHFTDEEVSTLSPLRLPPVQKPLILAYGSTERPALVHDSRALYKMRVEAGAPGSLMPIAGADHFSILKEFETVDGLLTRAALSLANS